MDITNINTWMGLIGGLIGIVSAVVAITVYATRLQVEGSRKVKAHEAEISEKRSTIVALEASVQALTQSVLLLRKGREDAYKLLTELDTMLGEIRNATGSTADSIFIRNPYADDSLIFLVAHGEAAAKIKRMKVPINKSLVGTVFQKGRPSIFPDPEAGQPAGDIDKKAGYQTNHAMSIPLVMAGEVVGVAQFLNKRDGAPFNSADLLKAQQFCAELAIRVRTIVADHDALKWLGIAETPDDAPASVLFADLSNSRELFRDLATDQVLELFSEYYDRLGSIVLRYGGTIDKALGDGFMARFNVPRRLTDFHVAAIRSALGMQDEFSQIKAEWLRVGRPVEKIANRIGVGSGRVIGSMTGHPQHLAYTVIGPAVNAASYLCDAARQTESGILICKNTYESASEMLRGVASFVGLESGSEEVRYEVRPEKRGPGYLP